MTHEEKRIYLIRHLLAESPRFAGLEIPDDVIGQRQLLRSLMNVRLPAPLPADFLSVQDEYLQERNKERGFTDIAELDPFAGYESEQIYLWRGDITTLKVDAIVNAANSGMTGCYQPCHSCIDNCIHTFAGIQLRNACAEIMKVQGHEEPTGSAKITPAFNLPCKFVLHTVGPIISGLLTERDCELLESCYRSCLNLAAENGVASIAFCCISTGVFCFPAKRAAEIAIETVRRWKRENNSSMKIVFNVFSEKDYSIYRQILGARHE